MTEPTPAPTVLYTERDVSITHVVSLGWPRGEGPIIKTPARDFRVTNIRLDYEWTPTGWASTIGPVNGHPLEREGLDIAHNRTRAIRPRDHTPDGWPTWLIALAAEHRPITRIAIQETP